MATVISDSKKYQDLLTRLKNQIRTAPGEGGGRRESRACFALLDYR